MLNQHLSNEAWECSIAFTKLKTKEWDGHAMHFCVGKELP